MPSKKKTMRGRSRSASTTSHIQSCALTLARELGPGRVTIDGISKMSGVAKTTIYRRWPNAAAVIMSAFFDEVGPSIAYQKQETLRATFSNVISAFLEALDEPRLSLLRHLIAEAQSDTDLARAFWERWIFPRRQQGLEVLLEQQVPVAQANAILDLIFGAIYYRILIPYAPIDEAWVKEIVGLLFKDIPDPCSNNGLASRLA